MPEVGGCPFSTQRQQTWAPSAPIPVNPWQEEKKEGRNKGKKEEERKEDRSYILDPNPIFLVFGLLFHSHSEK